ncbi:MAG: class I SAM-dependent methyltransferase [Spirochaetaceae bacterium]|nr:class I SAM-dependent methyltransferase [Spirochaetaceae bacterium]
MPPPPPPANPCFEDALYNADFYDGQSPGSIGSAKAVLPEVLAILPKVESAVDFGCGVGGWLAVLKELGVASINGYDGDWVDVNKLKIPKECFFPADLTQKIDVQRKYDLAMSLEVAEHLPESAAGGFVESIVQASDFVLFSAAIPLQGGTNHINEQWPDYWARLFRKNNYIPVDVLRNIFWNDDRIEVWYRQNLMLFVNEKRLTDIKFVQEDKLKNNNQLSLVHPQMYIWRTGMEFHAYKIRLKELYKISLKRTVKLILGQKLCAIIRNQIYNTQLNKKRKKIP